MNTYESHHTLAVSSGNAFQLFVNTEIKGGKSLELSQNLNIKFFLRPTPSHKMLLKSFEDNVQSAYTPIKGGK